MTGLLAISCASSTGSIHSDRQVSDYFGAETMDVVLNSDSIEVFRLEPGTMDTNEKAPTPAIEWQRELSGLLGRSSSYLWEIEKPCEPMPGVLARFHKGVRRVDAIFCFECKMLSMAPSGGDRWEDFDPINGVLVRLMKQVFPEDKAIQELKP